MALHCEEKYPFGALAEAAEFLALIHMYVYIYIIIYTYTCVIINYNTYMTKKNYTAFSLTSLNRSIIV